MTPAEHIRSHIQVDANGCWLWQLACKDTGYGVMSFKGRTRIAHRWSYEAFVGSIPEGLDLDHLCRVRNCVNPDHLEPVTRRINLLRGVNSAASRTACPSGHPYDETNTYRHGGRRYCRSCARARSRRRRAS